MRVLYVSLAVVILDQFTKILIKGIVIPGLNFFYEGMFLGQSIPVIGDFLRLTYVENAGMAFGLEVANRPILMVVTAVAIIFLFYYLYTIRNERYLNRLPFALILGGAIGNFIDRTFYGVIFGEGPLFYGRVVDFIDVDFFDINIFGYQMNRWAVFNIADASVTVGLVLMMLFYKSTTHQKDESSTEQLSEKEGMTTVVPENENK